MKGLISFLLFSAFVAGCAGAGRAQVVREWDFRKGLQGWAPGPTAHVVQAADGIVVTTDGNDPILVGPTIDVPPKPGDVLEVRLAASRPGEIQWFWRTSTAGPYGGFSQEQSRLASTGPMGGFATIQARPFWKGSAPVIGLRFDLPEHGPGVYRIASIRILRGSDVVPPVWRREYRVPVAPARIDLAKQAPPETRPVGSDYTVAMWYFAAWEPEYTWDGWQQVGERAPWRMPLLYDSADPAMEYNGIRYYRASNPRAVDWHVHWMREHAVNLMLWDWYPGVDADGAFSPAFFGNRALEIGFLGKERLGGPAVATNRFAATMPFAVMWTNHLPNNRVGRGLVEYIVDQFLTQPNYYRLDGRPLVPLWSADDLVTGAGGEAAARAVLDRLRSYARSRGLPDPYVAAVNGVATRERARRLGIDGVMGYNILTAGGTTTEYRRVGERVIEDRLEDFPTQSMRGHETVWSGLAGAFGRDYLLATCPMQNWEPTLRPTGYVIENHTPDGYREMLRRARAFIEQRGMRRFVTIEAFNEWLEGSYVEPSTQWGLTYLEAIRDAFRKR